jgi:O-antigen/teichoic acid export membrane protein
LTILASVVLSLGLVIVGLLLTTFGGVTPVTHLYAAAALILPLALAEYLSSALRAQGSVWTALVPRDVIWRAVLPLFVAGLFYLGIRFSGSTALLWTAAVLGAVLWLQYAVARRRGYLLTPGVAGIIDYWRERGSATRWFILGTVIDSASLNIDTILVGLFVSPVSAGIYFNAFRTAGLLTLFMFAITLVVAPMVAHHYHAGEMRKAQAITALCAWAGFSFSLVVFLGFVFFGPQVLSLFGGHQGDGPTILILLGIGLMFDAATGPSRIVMMMTGHERDYARIFGRVVIAGIALQFIAIPVFGLIGAAVVNMGSRIVAQLWISWWSRRNIGLDTSLLGIVQINRLTDGPLPAPAH